MKTQWSVCQRFPSCSVSPPTATHPLATSGDVVVESFALWHFLVASSCLSICFFIAADPLVGWSSTPLASTVTLLLPSRPPPCFLTWHLDTAVATAAALHVLPRSLCSSPSTHVVFGAAQRAPAYSRLAALDLFLFPFPLCSSTPRSSLQPPAASPSFWDISSLLLSWGLPQCRAPLRINTSSGIRQRGHTAAFQTHCVCGATCVLHYCTLCLCVCVLVSLQDGRMAWRRSDRQRSGKARVAALLWQSLHN